MRRETAELLGRQIGHIRLVDLLGEGGMGAVYAGFDDKLQRRVAVKAIRAEYRLDPATKARFLREARILSNLNHPDICTVHEYIEGESCDYLVLELVPGLSLGDAIRAGLSREQQLDIATKLLDVLVSVHARGVIHRDLKPENVMITPEGQVKVLDFGLARSISEQPGSLVGDTHILDGESWANPAPDADRLGPDPNATLDGRTITVPDAAPDRSATDSDAEATENLRTTAGTLIGTLGYMSPEQARGEPATAASDMYSLGLLLQELFTGESAFDRTLSRNAILKRAQRGMSRPVSGLEAHLTAFIERLKTLEPAGRPSSLDAAERLAWIRDAPRRRRNRVIKAAAWIVLALFATTMAVQSYRLAQARKREQLASRFGAEVERMDSQMRFAHMAPLHPLAEDMEVVRSRMDWIRENMAGRDDWGTAIGSYALGRGHLALGEHHAARAALEQAWQLGYREAEASYALGLALGTLYQEGLSTLPLISDPDKRAAERERLERELRDPAVRYLRQSQGHHSVAPEYVEGLLALYEGRLEEARALADRCSSGAVWFYECHLLEGDALILQSIRRGDRGEGQAALEALEQADTAFHRAIAVAASDPRGYAGLCKAWSRGMQLQLYDLGGDLQSTAERTLSACNDALTIDPAQPVVLQDKTGCYRVLAEDSLRREADPTRYLEQAKLSVRQLIEIAPDEAVAHHLSCITLMFSAMYQAQSGGDGTADMAAAVASQERAAELNPRDSGIQLDLGNAYHWYGRLLLQGGESPDRAFASGAEAFRRAIELRKDYAEAFNNLASLDLDRAEHALLRHGDPRAFLSEALEMCSRALEIKPNHMYSVANRGIAHLFMARYLAAQDEDPLDALDAAASSLEQAVELNADHPSNFYYLAEVAYEKARFLKTRGRPFSATVRDGIARAGEALRRAPGFPEVLDVRSRLQRLRSE